MRTKDTKITKYICENCGAEHSDRYEIFTHEDTEYCTSCGREVGVACVDIYNYDFKIEAYTTTQLVNPARVKATDLDLDLDRDEYLSRVRQAKQLYLDLMKKLETEYLKGTIRDFNVDNYVKIRFGL